MIVEVFDINREPIRIDSSSIDHVAVSASGPFVKIGLYGKSEHICAYPTGKQTKYELQEMLLPLSKNDE